MAGREGPYKRDYNSTSYVHPKDENLNNLHKAMEYNDMGEPRIRVTAEGLTLVGNVNLGGPVEIQNDEGNPIPISANLAVNAANNPIYVAANVTGGNINANVSGTVTVSSITNTANVNILNSPSVTVTSGNIIIQDGGGSITIDGSVGITGNVNIGTMPNVNATITSGNLTAAFTSTATDAFGRLRVSEPYTLFDSQNRYIDGQQFSTVTATSGTRTYVAAESSFNLVVTGASGSSVITQSYTTQPYQPGKSLLALNTFAMGTLKANCRQRVGYFTATDGVYFEADGTTINLVVRSSSSGILVEDRQAQSAWNGDKLNGSGASGHTLDPTLTQIFWCDIEWLGVGTVRAGFVINGEFIVCHRFHHANQAGNTRVYMTSATLNPRYEITNTGATSGSTTMKQICSTVISEGGFQPITSANFVSNGTNTTRISAANTLTAVASIRLNPSYPDAVVFPSLLALLLIDVRYGEYRLIENATFTATWNSVSNSVVQTATHSDTITDGIVVYSGLTSSRDEVDIQEQVRKRLQLKRDVSGTPIALTLAVAYTQTNTDLLYKLGWEEVSN